MKNIHLKTFGTSKIISWINKLGEKMLYIQPIKALDDNYIWCIKKDSNSNQCYFVDFGDIEASEAAIKNQNLDLLGILITHHHWDHTDGIATFIQNYKNSKGESPVVFGSKKDAHRLPPLNFPLEDNSEFYIFDKKVQVFEIPGHTLGHLAYLISDEPKHLFSGDTLFSAGCGRTFEGTSEQMYKSLQRLANQDGETLLYPAHEYTLANLKFAEYLEPNNEAIAGFRAKAEAAIAKNQATIPSVLSEQLEVNPFLRLNSKQIKSRLEEVLNKKLSDDPVEIFAHMRKLKDEFK